MLSTPNTQLARLLTRLAIVISTLVGISLPIVYGLIAYHDLSKSLVFKAKIKAHAQTDLITTLPDTWMYAENRINGMLSREPVVLNNELIQIFDQDGEVITSAGEEISRPKIQREYPLYDIGRIVGKVTVTASLYQFYKNILWVSLLGSILGFLVLLVLRLLPIRALQKITDELYSEKERAEKTLHSISDAVLVTDTEGCLIYFNLPAEKMLGRPLSELHGKHVPDLLPLTDKVTGVAVDSALLETLNSESAANCNERSMLEILGNRKIAIEERAAPLFDSNHKLFGGVLCLRDVTLAREYLELRSWEASHDALTGLINRREFENRVTEAIDTANSKGQKYVLCYMDLDRFKIVNDSSGHAAGDDLLKQITQIMYTHIRESDTLARLGGDEFGLLLEGCDEVKGETIANELLSAVEEFYFQWEDKVYTVGVSIGITTITSDNLSGKDVLSEADSACYWAKEQGRHQACTFRADDIELAARRSQTGWIERISSALKDDRFVLYRQTYTSLKSNDDSCLHIEILLRMISEDGELIAPDRFIPAAERYNLMPEVDRWVINKVFSMFHLLQETHSDKTLLININLSGTSINSLDILDFVKDKIAFFKVDPACLCFEITETVAVKHMRYAIEFINACKEIGIKFALDDFGTGTSSFEYLKSLPVDYLKIDGGFVKNIESDPVDRAMTEAINRIGHIMGKITIAEFAENQAIVEILDEMGVDFAQGFGISMPMPLIEDIEKNSSE